jgi:hypothetical membrane protein
MTTQKVVKARRFTSTFFATTAIACFAYAALAILLMHVLRPDYTPASHMISDYAVGRYGWVMATAFLALSCGNLMLLLGLARIGPSSVVARLGTLLLGIACIGLVVTAIFPTDLEEARSTHTGDIHTMSFLVNVGSTILAGCFCPSASERPTLAHLPAHCPDDGGSCRNRICPPVPDAAPRRALRSCQSVLRRDAVSLAAHDFNPVARVGA